jgi:alpha-L-rhamnosidase
MIVTRRTLIRNVSAGLMASIPAFAKSLPVLSTSRVLDITSHGAVGDGKRVNTRAIQAAIDACAAAGGGMIAVPAGIFVSGSIVLKPGVGLELRQDAVLRGSTNLADYPIVMRRLVEPYPEPLRMALVNSHGNHRVRIVGPGTLDGHGETFWRTFSRPPEESLDGIKVAYHFPQLCFLEDCEQAVVSGVTFKNTGFWNLHLHRCHGARVEDCRFVVPHIFWAPSSDGIDVDSCHDVTIRRCHFSVDDDCIALKGTQGPNAATDSANPPTERVLIQDCTFEKGHGCVNFGSNATIVRDIRVECCRNLGDMAIIRFKVRPDTPGQVFEHIHVKGIEISATADKTWHNGEVFIGHPEMTAKPPARGRIVEAMLWHGTKVPPQEPGAIIRDMTIEDVGGTTMGFGNISGNATTAVSDITFRNIDIRLLDPSSAHLIAKGVKGLKLENVRVNGAPAVVED